MAGLLGALPPGLRGYQAQRQFDMQEENQGLSQASGLLNMRNAMVQSQQAQKDQELKGLLGQKLASGDQEGAKALLMQYKPELFAKAMLPKDPKWQVIERFNRQTGRPEKVMIDLNNPSNVQPFGGQKAPTLSFGPDGVARDMSSVAPGTVAQDPNKTVIMGPNGPMVNPLAVQARSQIAAAGKPVINNINTSENSYAKALGGKSAEADLTQYDNAQLASDSLGKINMVIDQLQNSDVITGIGADVFKNVERMKALVTQSAAAGKKVSDTELMDSLLGSDVFPMIKALGIGARGLDTPAEREFLRQVMTGTINMNKDTLIRMAKIRKDVSERAVNRWNERVERGEVDRFFSQTGRKKQKFDIPVGIEEPQMRRSSDGQPVRKFNPATGRIE